MSHEKGIEAAIKESEDIDWVSCLFGTGIGSCQQLFEAQVKAYLDASGMVMVPRAPTSAMIQVVSKNWGRRTWAEFNDVLGAAPNPFQTPEESREKK